MSVGGAVKLYVFVDSVNFQSKSPRLVIINKFKCIADLRKKFSEDSKYPAEDQYWILNNICYPDATKIASIIEGKDQFERGYIFYLFIMNKVQKNQIAVSIDKYLKEKYSQVNPKDRWNNPEGDNIIITDVVSRNKSQAAVDWSCDTCTFLNKALDVCCGACGCSRQMDCEIPKNAGLTKEEENLIRKSMNMNKPQATVGWNCETCTFLNKALDVCCGACGCSRSLDYDIPKNLVITKGEQKIMTKPVNINKPLNMVDWICEKCSFLNKDGSVCCGVCGFSYPLNYEMEKNLVITKEEQKTVPEPAKETDKKLEEKKKMEMEQVEYWKQMKLIYKEQIEFSTVVCKCQICVGEFEAGQAVVLRDCLHVICKECLKKCLVINDPKVKCPMKNCVIIVKGGEINEIPKPIFVNQLNKVSDSAAELAAVVLKPKNNTKNKIADPDSMVLYLNGKQNHDGSWKYDNELIGKLGLDPAIVQRNKPDEISIDTWTTLLVLNFLETKLLDQIMDWCLVDSKAKLWIYNTIKESKTINSNQDIDEVMETFMKKALVVLNEEWTKECEISSKKIEQAISKEKKMQLFFVVDRSGSMQGEKILNAAQSLLKFLCSIPSGSIFQIFGFGTNFDKAFTQSQLYTEETFNKSKIYANNMKADFGNTDLFKPLNEIYNLPIINGYTNVIFIITDGCVNNVNQVVQLVQKNNTTKVYLVGLGKDVSEELVRKIAEVSFGNFIILRESKDLAVNVNQLFHAVINS